MVPFKHMASFSPTGCLGKEAMVPIMAGMLMPMGRLALFLAASWHGTLPLGSREGSICPASCSLDLISSPWLVPVEDTHDQATQCGKMATMDTYSRGPPSALWQLFPLRC